MDNSENIAKVACCGICCYMIVFVVIFTQLFARIAPNYCGIQINELTKTINEDRVYNGGLYFLGFFQGFYDFPLHVQTIEFEDETVLSSNVYSIRLSYSVQYKLRNTEAGEILFLYKEFQTNDKIKGILRSSLTSSIKDISVGDSISQLKFRNILIKNKRNRNLVLFFKFQNQKL